MTNREWRSVPGFPLYEVSEDGALRSVGPRRPGQRIHKEITGGVGSHGYREHTLKNRKFKTHRLVCEAFHGPAPEGRPYAAHNDGDKANNHYTNLRWASQSENIADCRLHGTANIGSRNGRAKLSEQDVLTIKHMLECGVTHQEVAGHFGCSRQAIGRIGSGKQWGHVTSRAELGLADDPRLA